jgi:hypothetical protein
MRHHTSCITCKFTTPFLSTLVSVRHPHLARLAQRGDRLPAHPTRGKKNLAEESGNDWQAMGCGWIVEAPDDSRLQQCGLDLFASRPDKSGPFTDYTSFVVRQDAGIHEALTADQLSGQAGFKPLLARPDRDPLQQLVLSQAPIGRSCARVNHMAECRRMMRLCGQQSCRHRVCREHFVELPEFAQPVYHAVNGSNMYAFGVPTTQPPLNSATASQCWVWGNMSNGVTRSSR